MLGQWQNVWFCCPPDCHFAALQIALNSCLVHKFWRKWGKCKNLGENLTRICISRAKRKVWLILWLSLQKCPISKTNFAAPLGCSPLAGFQRREFRPCIGRCGKSGFTVNRGSVNQGFAILTIKNCITYFKGQSYPHYHKSAIMKNWICIRKMRSTRNCLMKSHYSGINILWNLNIVWN